MKKKQKKYIRNYYWISVFVNLVPLLIMIVNLGRFKGEAQLGYLIFGIWGFICLLVYVIYFTIPEFDKNWEKFAGLVLPTAILSLGLIEFPLLWILIVLNLIMNGMFILYFNKKMLANIGNR